MRIHFFFILNKNPFNKSFIDMNYVKLLQCINDFQRIGPLADSFIELRCPSVLCMVSPPHAVFFEASHWPSRHMIRSRPVIGRPSARKRCNFPTSATFSP